MKRAILILLALAGCATREKPRPVDVKTQTVEVAIRAPCPDPVEHDRLKKARPEPLRGTPVPQSARERVAKAVAQLLRYEGRGGLIDQLFAALDRCQEPN